MKTLTRGLGVLPRMTMVLLLLTIVAASSAQTVAAQADSGLVSDTEYESPQFDITFNWSSAWTADEADVSTEDGQLDQFQLTGTGAILRVFMIFASDAGDTVDAVLQGSQEPGNKFEELGRTTGRDYVAALADWETTDNNDEPLPVREYVEVRSDLQPKTGNQDALLVLDFFGSADTFDTAFTSAQNTVFRDQGQDIFLSTPDDALDGSTNQTDDGNDPTPTEETIPKPNTDEAGISGGEFVSANFSFSVSWTEADWTATDDSSKSEDALVLDSDFSQVQLRASAAESSDLSDCVASRANILRESEGVTKFSKLSRGYTIPGLAEGAFGRLYGYTLTETNGDTIDLVVYLECRPLKNDGDLLVVSFLSTDASYEDELPKIQKVIDSIEIGRAATGNNDKPKLPRIGASKTPTGDDTTPAAEESTPTPKSTSKIGKSGNATATPTPKKKKTGIVDNTFVAADFDFQIAWDGEIWTPKLATPDTGYEGLTLTSANATAFIEAFAGDGDPEACLTASGANLEDIEGASDIKASRTLDPPASAKRVAGQVYTYTFTGDNGPVPFVEYVECRELEKGASVLRVEIFTVDSLYADEVAVWEDLLTGIKVGTNSTSTKSTPTTGGKKTPTPDTTSAEWPGVEGSTFTSTSLGYAITWPKGYNVVLATSDESGDLVLVGNGSSILIIGADTSELDPNACLAAKVDNLEKSDGVTNVAIVTDNDGNDISGSDASTAYALYSYTDSDNGDQFEYIRCVLDPTEAFMVTLTVLTPVEGFEQAANDIQSIIESITFP